MGRKESNQTNNGNLVQIALNSVVALMMALSPIMVVFTLLSYYGVISRFSDIAFKKFEHLIRESSVWNLAVFLALFDRKY